MTVNVDAREAVFVARQPILDETGKVFGYELLYRNSASSGPETEGGDETEARGLTDAVLTLGLDRLAEGRPAFLNFTRALLIGQAGTLLPAAMVVVQLRRGILVDDDVVTACQDLHAKGYKLALDFVSDPEAERLLPYVEYVKIDVQSISIAAQTALVKRFAAGNVRPIAEKVETVEAFQAARQSGFALFQGYYFCKPVTCKAAALPARRQAYLQLLSALGQPDVGVREIEELVKHDVSLSLRVLRCVNSAACALRTEVTSIREALLMIGLEPIRKWVTVWSVAGLNTGGTSELLTVSLLRARCCEMLGQQLPGRSGDSELFLLGLCSLLDAIIDRPLAEAIADLPLGPEVKSALLGEDNPSRAILDMVIAYEAGQWDEAIEKARALGLPDEAPAKTYAQALDWARVLSRAAE
jgi:EAL and modified HD-GYP domain-containing signal transduction protein